MLTKRLLRLCALNDRRWKVRGILCRRFHHEFDECTSISLSLLKQTLKQQKINFSDGHTCLITECTVCDSSKSKGSKIYINKTTGFFMCDKCKHAGSWHALEKFIVRKKSNKINDGEEKPGKILEAILDYPKEWDNLQKKCLNILDVTEDDYLNILDRISISNISRNDLAQLNCIYDNALDTLHFPLLALQNTIVGHKSFSIQTGVEQTNPTTDASGILSYKKKHVRTDGTAVLVLTIQDMLALISNGISATVICLPYNSQHLPQQLLPSLEAYKKLILWFHNDEPSWDTARQFAKKLDEKRCYFVRPTDLQPRPKVASTRGYDLNKILQSAQPIWHKSVTTFQNIREDILSDLQNTEKVQGIKWKRYPALNRILKGHRRGEFTVLTGPTGCGKTTFMSEYSLDLAMQGVNTLWGSFEIRNTRLARTMLQQMAGVSLDDNLNNFDEYADAFEKLPIYFLTFHGQQSIKVVMDAVEHATYVHDIAHVIIDNVQFMMGTLDEKYVDRFWKQDKIIACFRTFATKFNCHVTLVIHPRKERHDEELTTSSIFGSAKASQEADNILIIQDRRLTSLRGKKYLQVAKNRYSGDLGVMLLDFDKSSLSYGQKKKKLESPSTKSEDSAEQQNIDKKKEKKRKILQDTESS